MLRREGSSRAPARIATRRSSPRRSRGGGASAAVTDGRVGWCNGSEAPASKWCPSGARRSLPSVLPHLPPPAVLFTPKSGRYPHLFLCPAARSPPAVHPLSHRSSSADARVACPRPLLISHHGRSRWNVACQLRSQTWPARVTSPDVFVCGFPLSLEPFSTAWVLTPSSVYLFRFPHVGRCFWTDACLLFWTDACWPFSLRTQPHRVPRARSAHHHPSGRPPRFVHVFWGAPPGGRGGHPARGAGRPRRRRRGRRVWHGPGGAGGQAEHLWLRWGLLSVQLRGQVGGHGDGVQGARVGTGGGRDL